MEDDDFNEDGAACDDGAALPPCAVELPALELIDELLAEPIDEEALEPPEKLLCEAPPALAPPELGEPPDECCESIATESTMTAAKRKPESRMKHLPDRLRQSDLILVYRVVWTLLTASAYRIIRSINLFIE